MTYAQITVEEISGLRCQECYRKDHLFFIQRMRLIGLNITGDLPAKEVIPLETIHLLEFRFIQQAVTQSWVYGHVTVARERNDQNTHHPVN